jgi:hypothetical protein
MIQPIRQSKETPKFLTLACCLDIMSSIFMEVAVFGISSIAANILSIN